MQAHDRTEAPQHPVFDKLSHIIAKDPETGEWRKAKNWVTGEWMDVPLPDIVVSGIV